jgi:undecaprenyl-diphosphatase
VTASRARWAVLGAALVAAFVALGLAVDRRPFPVDVAIQTWLQGQYQRPAGRVAQVVSDVLGPVLPVVFGAVLLIAAALWWRRGDRHRAGVLLRIVVVLLACRLTSAVAKPLFDRQRPRDYPDLSYPSGHVVSAASTGFAAILLAIWLAPRLLRWIGPIAVLATALCAAARMVLGVHWFTDTLGSVLVVTGIGILVAVAVRLLPVHQRVPGAPGGVTSHG